MFFIAFFFIYIFLNYHSCGQYFCGTDPYFHLLMSNNHFIGVGTPIYMMFEIFGVKPIMLAGAILLFYLAYEIFGRNELLASLFMLSFPIIQLEFELMMNLFGLCIMLILFKYDWKKALVLSPLILSVDRDSFVLAFIAIVFGWVCMSWKQYLKTIYFAMALCIIFPVLVLNSIGQLNLVYYIISLLCYFVAWEGYAFIKNENLKYALIGLAVICMFAGSLCALNDDRAMWRFTMYTVIASMIPMGYYIMNGKNRVLWWACIAVFAIVLYQGYNEMAGMHERFTREDIAYLKEQTIPASACFTSVHLDTVAKLSGWNSTFIAKTNGTEGCDYILVIDEDERIRLVRGSSPNHG